MTDIPRAGLTGLVQRAVALVSCIPYWFVGLIARISIASVFWRSGQTKLEDWRVSDNAIELFRSEYKLPLLDPTLAAWLATFAEHLFPILLVIGLATRLSALALLVMTLVIQIFVYPDAWPTHGTWAAIFLMLMVRGAGEISLDHLIAQRVR